MNKEEIKEFAQKRWVRWVLLIIIILLLLWYNYYQYQKISGLEEDRARMAHNTELLKQEIKFHKNRAGEMTATVEMLRVRASEMDANYSEIKKSMEKFAKNIKDIQSYVQVVTITKDSIVIKHDSITMTRNDTVIRELPFTQDTDSFMRIEGKVTPTAVEVNYTYKSKLEVVQVWEKQGLGIFKAPKLKLSITSANPKEQIVNVVGLNVEKPKPKFWQTTGFKFGSGFTIGVGLITMIYFLAR